MEIVLTSENFEAEVLSAKQTVLVDFWATWCGPCRMIAPEIEAIAAEGKVKVGKVNVDEQAQLANRYGIESIPTVLIFKDGKEIARHVGGCEKQDIADFCKANLG